MNLIVVTEPPALPVTLAQLYGSLRLDPVGSPPEHPADPELTRYLATATATVEAITRRALVEQRLRLLMPNFPWVAPAWARAHGWSQAYFTGKHAIELRRPPIISVASVRYYDENNVLQTVDTDDWFVTDEIVPKVQFVSGFTEPVVYDREDAVRVDYTAGYTPSGSPPDDYAANIPEAIKDAVILGVQMLYDKLTPQEAEQTERARDSLLGPYVITNM